MSQLCNTLTKSLHYSLSNNCNKQGSWHKTKVHSQLQSLKLFILSEFARKIKVAAEIRQGGEAKSRKFKKAGKEGRLEEGKDEHIKSISINVGKVSEYL